MAMNDMSTFSVAMDGWGGLPNLLLAGLPPVMVVFLVGLLALYGLRAKRLRSEVNTLKREVNAAGHSLKNSDRDLRNLFAHSAVAVVLLDRETRAVLHANNTALAVFGIHTEEQLTAQVMQCPDDWGGSPFGLRDFERQMIRTSRSGIQTFEWQVKRAGRATAWLEVSLSLVTFQGAQAMMFSGIDITARKHADRADGLRHKAMASMARDSALHVTLDHLAAMAEVALPGAQCAIMVHEDETNLLRWVGSGSMTGKLRESLDRLPVAFGAASCGTAAYIRGRVVSRDIQSDERWEQLRSQAESAGLRSCWSEPMFGSNGKLLGTFDVYHETPWEPGDGDIDGLTGPLYLASLTIERYRSKVQLEQMIQSEQMVRRISTDLLTLNTEETDQGINRTCRALGEYFQADGVFLYQIDATSNQLHITHEWVDEAQEALSQASRGAPMEPQRLQDVFADQSCLVVTSDNGHAVCQELLPGLLRLKENQSVMLAAVRRQAGIVGFLGMLLTSSIEPWTSQRTQTLQLMASLLSSVMMRKELVGTLTFQAVHDQLTGLYNRHKIEDFLSKEVARCSRYGSTFSLIIFDLDHFKSINDRFGHGGGDEVLSSVAELMKNNIREAEIAGRWGGEEFLLILPETTLEYALMVAERLRASVEGHSFTIPDTVTISMGVSAYLPKDTSKQIVQRADDALYRAKESGRNCVQASER